jgi:L-threonylcarbamoyladenylate synthase
VISIRQIQKLHPDDPAGYQRLLDESVKILTGGGIAILPAEGVYGLHTCTCTPEAGARLRKIKQEQKQRPYIILIGSSDSLAAICSELSASQRQLIESVWPGPLTLLLPANRNLAGDLVLQGRVAVRCPGSGFLRDLARLLPGLLLSTSANRAGQPAPARTADLDPQLMAEVDLAIDGGELANQGSTLASINEAGELVILRQGLWRPV